MPVVASTYVNRPRLVAALDAAAPDGIVVIHGPAGSGKTSLVADWIGTLERPVSWLTLDDRDRNAPELWANLLAAIDRLRPGCLDQLAGSLRKGEPSDAIVAELVVALDESHGAPATLVIDDFQMVADDASLVGFFRDLLRHLPRGLQLVVVSRSLPALSLDRVRLEGKVTMVGFDDLRFSVAEATELLGRMIPDVDESWSHETVAHMGGWAAGLQLFALATRSTSVTEAELAMSPAAEVAGVESAMQSTADYLLAEAFRDQPTELLELLREIAVVGRVNVPLARALSRRDDAGDLLLRAYERDLFVSRRGRGWYELHSLVRDVLLAQLDEDPERAGELQARAAAYFEGDRDFPTALDHWLKAGRHRDALRLLSEVHLALYDAGRHDVVRTSLAAIPVEAYATDFSAMLEFTWCQVLVDRDRFLDGITRLSWWAQRTPLDGRVAARLALVQSVATTIRGDWIEGGRLARQAMAEFGPDWILDPYGRFGLNMVARDVALSERWHDGDDDIRRADLELAQDPVRRVSFEGIRALGEAIGGHPLAALQTAAGIRRVADVTNMAILGDELRLAEAIAGREVGAADGVHESLVLLADTDVAPMTYVRLLALSELVADQLAGGAVDAAASTVDQLQLLVEHATAGPAGRSALGRRALDVALASDDVDTASRWLEAIDDAFWLPLGRGRIQLAQHDRQGALAAFADAVPRCAKHDVVLALQRAAATAEHEEALKLATSAVELAVTHGMVQTVAAQGSTAVELVERCAWRAPESWLDRVRMAAVGGFLGRGGSKPGVELLTGADPLTEREREVLRFLPSRLTLQEIASELYISMNTLKFHLKVIYRKLGVSSRAEAAAVARQFTTSRNG